MPGPPAVRPGQPRACAPPGGGTPDDLPAMNRLTEFGERKILPDSLVCILRVHNEAPILGEFFRHHRKLGAVSFLVVDDRSTDATPDILREQPDVTVFHPADDSHYRNDKKLWVNELLDRYCTDRWALCLDADEHLVYRNMESRTVHDLIAQLEREKADGFPAVMLDMYADKPLAEHSFSGGSLKDEFPYFDDPATYRVRYKKRARLFHASGGMRFRLFARKTGKIVPPGFPLRFGARRGKFRLFCKRKLDQVVDTIHKRILRNKLYRPNSLKVPLIYWREGMAWDEHNIADVKRQSAEMGALLHFKMAKGIGGIEYLADRGQHAGEGLYSRWILSTENLEEINPVCPASRKFIDSPSIYGGSRR